MDYLLALVVMSAMAAWWISARTTKRSLSERDFKSKEIITDDELIELQQRFERRLDGEQDLPDGIRGMDAYIYWNLMRPWFERLSAENRYNEKLFQQIRRDWVDYMHLLPGLKVARYLAMESQDQKRSSEYERDVVNSLRKITAIQEAFAAKIGGEATALLSNVRNRSPDAFDRTGKLPVAPDDHHYFPVSINPYLEECRPKNKVPMA